MPVKKRSTIVKLCDACRAPINYKPQIQGVTQSLLGGMLTCPMRGMLALNRWGSPAKASKTRFGSLFHGLLERAYRESKPAATQLAEQWLRETVAGLRAEYGAKGTEQAERDICTAVTLWDEYRKFHAKDWERMDPKLGKTELEFEFPFDNIVVRGKIDGLIPDRHGGLWQLEHKTHGQIDDEYLMAHLSIDLQVLVYQLALRRMGFKKILGVKYNVVRNPGLKSDGLPLLAYRDKLREHIQKDPAHYFHRYEVRVLESQIKEFEVEFGGMLDTFRMYAGGVRPPYRNSSACRAPWPCEYLGACSSGNMNGYVQREHLNPELDYWKKEPE